MCARWCCKKSGRQEDRTWCVVLIASRTANWAIEPPLLKYQINKIENLNSYPKSYLRGIWLYAMLNLGPLKTRGSLTFDFFFRNGVVYANLIAIFLYLGTKVHENLNSAYFWNIQGVFYDDPFFISPRGRYYEDIDLRFYVNCRRRIVCFYMQHAVNYSLFFLENEHLKKTALQCKYWPCFHFTTRV